MGMLLREMNPISYIIIYIFAGQRQKWQDWLQCYASVTRRAIPLTKRQPHVKLPTVNLETPCPAVLPGTDTGPASHGMCSGADKRVVLSEDYKLR